MSKSRQAWWTNQQYQVRALTPTGEQVIYMSRLKSQCQEDARAWTKATGQHTVVEAGPGNIRRRRLAGLA